MRITNLTQLANEYEKGKVFKVHTSNGLVEYSIANKTVAELDNLISYYKLVSVTNRAAVLTEWLFLTELEGVTYVPSNGICWACEQDLVQHYLDTEEFSATKCPLCDYDFVDDQ